MYAAHGTSNVKIKNSHCGICGSDLHAIESEEGPSTHPCVVGHEIIGEVTLAGPDAKYLKVGDRVGVSALAWSCLNKDPSIPCKECSSGDDAYCTHSVWTYDDKYKNDGATSHGDYVRVAHEFALKIPDKSPSDVAAPLLCAGATVHTSLKENDVKPDKRVGVVDIGGLGHLGIEFANAMGADAVVAFSRSTEKEQKMGDLGATEFVVERNKKQAATGIDLADVFRSSYAKVLAAIALLACVAAKTATSAWIPQDVMRSSRALKAAYMPVQTKRNLRLNASKSDHTYNFEERGPPLLVITPAKILKEDAEVLDKLPTLNADLVNKAAAQIIGGFEQRLENIHSMEMKEDQYDHFIELLAGKVDDYTLAKFLTAAEKNKISVAKDLQAAQNRRWQANTAADVFDILKLGTTEVQLFKNPLFYRLVGFIESIKTDKKLYSTLYSTLSSKLDDDVLVKTLVEGLNSKNSIFPTLLQMRLVKAQLAAESMEKFEELEKLDRIDRLGKDEAKATKGLLQAMLEKSEAFFDRKHPDLDDLVWLERIFGKYETAEMLAMVNEESSVLERVEYLRVKQFKNWKGMDANTLRNNLKEAGVADDVSGKIVTDYNEDKLIPVVNPVKP